MIYGALLVFIVISANGILSHQSAETNHRHRRDLNGLKETTDRLQSIARIVNAIYVYREFERGKIYPEDFGSEILRLGSSSLSGIDEAKLKNGIQALEHLPFKIQGNAEVKKFEEYFGIVEEILKPLEGIETLNDWPGRKDFEEDIGKIKNKTFDVQIVTDITDSARDWKNMLNLAKDKKQIYLPHLLKYSKYLLSHANSPPQLPKVFQFKGHQSAASSLSDLSQMAQSLETLRIKSSGLDLLDEPKQAMKINLEGLTDSANKVGATVLMLLTVQRILESRAYPPYSYDYKLTAGFPEGQEDVGAVFVDLTEPWIQRISDSSKLSSALELLKRIGAKPDSLQKLDGNYIENSETISQVISLSETFLSAAEYPAKFMDTSEVMSECVGRRRASTVEPIDKLKILVKEIDQELVKVNAEISTIASNLKNQDLKDLLKKTVEIVEGYENKNGTDLQKVFDDLKNNMPKTIPISGIRVNMPQLLQPLIEKSGEIEREFRKIDRFLETTSPYDAFWQCLRNVTDRDAFFSSIKIMKFLRESNGKQEYDEFIKKASNIVMAVIGAKDDLKSIQTVATATQSSKLAYMESLWLFTDMAKHSELIGGATRGVLRMRKVIENKQDLQFVVQNLGLVKNELDMKQDNSSVAPNDEALIQDLLTINGSIQSMLASLDEFEKSVTVPTYPNNLAALSSIFESALKVQGVDKDLVAMAEAVGRLSKDAQDSTTRAILKKMATTLVTFGSIGLDFSQHTEDFKRCPSSLTRMDALFFRQKSESSAIPTCPPCPKSEQCKNDCSSESLRSATVSFMCFEKTQSCFGAYVIGVVSLFAFELMTLAIYCCLGKSS